LNKGGRVVTVDIRKPKNPPEHPRLFYVTGDSVSPDTVRQVKSLLPRGGKVMVILDSNHKKNHVLKEMQIYGDLVSVGSYMIVEDTNLNRIVREDHGPGPGEAIDAFMTTDKRYVVDPDCEKFYMTFNPGGYLKRLV